MSQSVNRACLLGNIGNDPELRHTQQGTAILRFSLATNEGWFDKQTGEDRRRTEWHNCLVWGKRAEGLARFLTKGFRIYLEGNLRTSSWQDRETGAKRYRTEIHVRELVPLGGAKAEPPAATPPPQDPDSPPADPGWPDDDDIPF